MRRDIIPWVAVALIFLLTSLYFAFQSGKRAGLDAGYRKGLQAAPEFIAYRKEQAERDEAEAKAKQAAFPDKASTCDRIILMFTDRRPLDADDLCYQVREMVIEDLEDEHNAEQEYRQEYQQDRW
jgi:hypothetical protein